MRVAALVLCLAVVTAVGLVSGAAYVRPPKGDPPPLVVVRIAGSSPFYNDLTVQAIFRRNGLLIQPESDGSLQASELPGLSTNFDIAALGSADTAQLVKQKLTDQGVDVQSFSPYRSPIVIVTHQPVIQLLIKAKVVRKVGTIFLFDIRKYLDLVSASKHWKDLPGNQAYQIYHDVHRVLVSSTDPEQSDSGANFAAILLSAQLHDDPPTGQVPARYLNLTRDCFKWQGGTQWHTPDLVRQFQNEDIPMAVVYENDYLTMRLKDPDVAVMYPDPTIDADNTLVWWKRAGKPADLGQRVVNLLTGNPALKLLEEHYGYRTAQDADFVQYWHKRDITVPSLDPSVPGSLLTVPQPKAPDLKKLAWEADHG